MRDVSAATSDANNSNSCAAALDAPALAALLTPGLRASFLSNLKKELRTPNVECFVALRFLSTSVMPTSAS